VSPGYSDAVAARASAAGLPYLPGVATATEIQAATERGFEVVKFFPARQLGGVAAIAALSAPFEGMRFMPSGGVTIDDLPAYLSHPAVPFVAGGWMLPHSAIERGDFGAVTELARESATVSGRDLTA
jgi:2-dehydro-3-deoxyphosphogluconate aldolase/(4S)-4-hydroxy-2-oxoglutarate aldolase